MSIQIFDKSTYQCSIYRPIYNFYRNTIYTCVYFDSEGNINRLDEWFTREEVADAIRIGRDWSDCDIIYRKD